MTAQEIPSMPCVMTHKMYYYSCYHVCGYKKSFKSTPFPPHEKYVEMGNKKISSL